MSNLSDVIESFIKELLDQTNSSMVEIQRNILAQQFDCAPSQINYVLTTRFNNDKGYLVESRRGGGGYVKICRVDTSKDKHIENLLNSSIGTNITVNKANDILEVFQDKGIINSREEKLIKSAISDRAFNKIYHEDRNRLRADILKEIMLTLIEDKS